MRHPLLLLLLAIATFVFGACHSQSSAKSDTITFTDDYNNTLQTPAHAERIVSLSPGVTEIIYALGAQDRLVGRTDFCSYPAECRQIESIGGITNLNVEKIVALKPDLVIGCSMIPQGAVEQLGRLGIPVACLLEQPAMEGLFRNIESIGLLTDRQEEALQLNEQLRSQLPLLDTTQEGPTVYYVAGFGAAGNYTAGGNTFINDIIRRAGGRNIAAEMEGWSYSLEALMGKDPDYVVIRREDSARFVETHPYNKLKAVKQGHVVTVESGTIDVQVPRNIEAINTLRKGFTR